MRGGKRQGAGRKPGSVSAAKARLQQTVRDVAAQVLSEVDAVAVWKKLILQQEKPQVVAQVMEYLTDRVHGRPAQTIQGNAEQPVSIQLQWSGMPEWLPSVTVNQQVNHITAATDRAEEIRQVHRRADSLPEIEQPWPLMPMHHLHLYLHVGP